MSDNDDEYAAAAAADYYADYDNYRDAGSDEEDALPDTWTIIWKMSQHFNK